MEIGFWSLSFDPATPLILAIGLTSLIAFIYRSIQEYRDLRSIKRKRHEKSDKHL